MACCANGGSGDTEQDKKNKEINRQIKADAGTFENEFRLLLLGAGESGKSTIAKQMKILHLNGFTDEELDSYKPLIHQNIYSGVKTILTFMEENGVKLDGKKLRSTVKKIVDPDSGYFEGEVTPAIAGDFATLWKDAGVQKAFERRAEYQLSDCVPYYMGNIERIGTEDYRPSEQDVLRSRAKTTGIIETEFEVDGTRFRMVDVGGQRSERKKWMHCFQDVTSVLFCVALSEYNLKLEEDEETNRMTESLTLFNQICNSKWFTKTSMILFLNKRDLFEEKIKKVPLSVCFDDYKGSNNWEDAARWIGEKFSEQNKSKSKQVYVHITCATDTGNVRFVFNAVKDIILHQALDASGLNL